MRKSLIVIALIFIFLTSSCVSQLNTNNTFNNISNADIVKMGDGIIYKVSDSYFVNIAGKVCNLPESIKNIRTNQIYLSQDFEKVYYNTDFTDTLGRIFVYEIQSEKIYDLLDNLGIGIDGYIAAFTYQNQKIAAVIGEEIINKDTGTKEKRETNKLLLIDLVENTYNTIELAFVPHGISSYSGLDFIGGNILMCQSEFLCDYKTTQCIVEIDTDGNFIKKHDIYNSQGIYNIQASQMNDKIAYQVGQTPIDVYVYDINTKSKQQVLKSDAVDNYSYCIYSTWSNTSNALYYITLNTNDGGQKEEYELHLLEF